MFVQMFVTGAGISPELTQAVYRRADSCTNVITPPSAYLIIMPAVLRRYMPAAGLGTIIALMLRYCLAIHLFWTALPVRRVPSGMGVPPMAAYAPLAEAYGRK